MLGDLFDSPWKILIIAAVVLVLFGSKKMPDAARSLGRSMRILKAEMKDLHEDDDASGAQAGQAAQQQPQPPQQLAAPAVGVPAVPVTTAEGVPVAAPVAPVAAPVAPAAAPPASAPLPAEVQQDTRPA
jgi:sec-independent protein translocase protein TatA